MPGKDDDVSDKEPGGGERGSRAIGGRVRELNLAKVRGCNNHEAKWRAGKIGLMKTPRIVWTLLELVGEESGGGQRVPRASKERTKLNGRTWERE